MSERETFTLPVSDCGCFIAGELHYPPPEGPGEPPKFGVIVWYKDKEVSRAACMAAMQAHWK